MPSNKLQEYGEKERNNELTHPKYNLWTLSSGIHDIPAEEATITTVRKVTTEDKKRWMDVIHKLERDRENKPYDPLMSWMHINHNHGPKEPYNQDILQQLIDSFNSEHSKIEEKTPLALFVSDSQLFYELFYPYARSYLGRGYYILQFENPLMVELKFVYEIYVSHNDQLNQPMIYLGCLSERVPILTAIVNDTRESIVPFELLVPAVKSLFEESEDWVMIRDELELEDNKLEQLVRDILAKSKPQFIEFSLEKYTEEKLVIASMTANGSLLEDKNSKSESKNGGIITKIKLSIRHVLVKVYNLVFSLSLKEPIVHLQIYPKASSASHWIYIYGPKNYHLQERLLSTECKHNTLEKNSPDNPSLLSYRVGRREQFQSLCKIDLDFSVQVPRMDRFWLHVMDKLLLSFFFIWFVACLDVLPLPYSLSPITNIAVSIVRYNGVLESNFVLISFALLARSWFFHESTIYKETSRRLAILIVLLAFISVLFIVLYTIFIQPNATP